MNSVNMQKGQKAKVFSVGKGGQFQRKMFEMGILPGVEIELIARHPFHGPLLFKVGHTNIALGRNAASALEVELL